MFRDGESVCLARTVFDVRSQPVSLNNEHRFVSINPLAAGSTRANANISEHRNFLVEFDGGDLASQLADIVAKELPFATLVFSGSKSIHAIVSLTDSVTKDDWQQASEYLRVIFPKSDGKVKDASRLTRLAGGFRDNGVEQELLAVGKRISPKKFAAWLMRFHKAINRFEESKKRKEANIVSGGGQVSSWVFELITDGKMPEHKASRHDAIRDAGVALYRSGTHDLDTVERLLYQAADKLGIERDVTQEINGIIKMLARG